MSITASEVKHLRTISAVLTAEGFSKWMTADLGSAFSLYSMDSILKQTRMSYNIEGADLPRSYFPQNLRIRMSSCGVKKRENSREEVVEVALCRGGSNTGYVDVVSHGGGK